jgi:transposase
MPKGLKKGLVSKKLDGRKLTHSQSEYIRIQAVKAVREKGQSPEQVIKIFGLHRTNIYKWLRVFDAKGFVGLQSTKSKGPISKLSAKQKQQLYKYLLKNPTQLKFEYALWTVSMIIELIRIKFGVTYSGVQTGRILKEIGFSKQKPLERAYQQDPEKVKAWLGSQYPAIILVMRPAFKPPHSMGRLGPPKAKRPLLGQRGNAKK